MPNQNIQNFTPATPMVRMANGTLLPAASMNLGQPVENKKLLIVLQYYGGDREIVEDLGSLIADLERIKNKDADILIWRRFDAPEFSRSVRSKLEDKFGKVYFETCRRRDASKYPFAANQMWNDLVTMVGQFNPWRANYYAFLPLESDCTPVRPGWIGELIEAFRFAKVKNLSAVGHIQDDPVRHMNGVGVYDINIWGIVGSGKLNGGDPQVAYDIYHREDILPHAVDTSLIVLQFQKPTIKAEDLFAPRKNGIVPALFHGVKDASAREAVRAKYVTFSGVKDIANKTVFAFQAPTNGAITLAEQQKTDLWIDGWRSRGWNPVVLRPRDASKNAAQNAALAAIEKLPFAADREDGMARLRRWVALESVGGGLLVDLDILPGRFSPDKAPTGTTLLHSESASHISAAFFTRKSLEEFLSAISEHVAQPKETLNGVSHVTDLSILNHSEIDFGIIELVKACGVDGWHEAALVDFDATQMAVNGVRGTQNQAMEEFLRRG